MALYSYTALSAAGKKVTGTLDADSLTAAREQLTRKQLYIISIELGAKKQTPFYARMFQRPLTLKDKLFFTRQLSVLLGAGVPLVDALDLLVDQTVGAARNIVAAIRDEVKAGKSLAESLEAYPDVFENLYIQLIKAGEASGKLEAVLQRLFEYIERQGEIRGRIKGAIRYPLIQLGAIIAVSAGIVTFVLPQIATVLGSSNKPLPAVTATLLSISDFITEYWFLIVILLAGLIAAYVLYTRTAQGKYYRDTLFLRIPIIQYFTRTNAVVQFSRTLGLLLQAGVTLSEALSIVSGIVDNTILQTALKNAKENIIKRGRITIYLKETGLFPSLALYLINTGEQSGELDTMLIQVAKQYESEVTEYADGLTDKINPIMMVIMTVLVGGLVFAVMGPLMSMGESLNV